MKQIFTSLVMLVFAISTSVSMANSVMPLNDNAIAPDFTVNDINGVSHTLYDYLDDGKMVILDFSATWCPPCWSYHQSNVLKDIYNTYGPPGTDEVMVLFVEADPSTPVSALYGTGNTQGDWVTGTPYPIIDDGNGSLNSAYQISFFPTLYAVCSDRKIYEVGQTSISGWLNRLESCGLEGSVVSEDVTCFGDSDGSIDLTSFGGYGSVDYSWNTGDNTEDIDNLVSGNYAVTITDLFNRQVTVDNIFVSTPAPVTVNTISTQSVSCNGGSDGIASVNAAGGNAGFSYLWSNGDTGATITNISAGAYTVTATDSEGCVGSTTVIISQPTQVSAAANIQAENCGNSDGFLFVSASGGTLPYLYDFGNGQTANPILNGISAGTYDVTITDLLGCTYEDSYVVPENPAPDAIVAAPQSIDCNNASIDLDGTASSSGPEYSYTWTTTDGSIVAGATTLTPTVEAAGTYILEVFNTTNACVSSTSVVVTEDVSLPTADAGAGGSIDCINNVLTLVGTASQGANISYQWTTTNGNINSDPTALEIDVDEAGTYILEVTNSDNGCVVTSSTDVVGNFDFPVASAAPAPMLDCINTSVALDATGSDAGSEFSYLWSTADGNIVSGETTLTPVVDAVGTYVLTVLNTVNGCTSNVDVTVIADATLPVVDIATASQIDCINSTVVLDGTGSDTGTDYTYLWTTTNGNIVSGSTTLNPLVDAAGSYELTISNNINGCSSTEVVTVSEDTTIPVSDAGPSAEFICSTNSVFLDGSGSETGANITYTWTTSDGVIIGGADVANPEVGSPGTYVITTTNTTNGCSSSDEVLVTDNTVAPSIASTIEGELSCNNSEVSIDASASTADGVLEFLWTDLDGNIINTTEILTVNEPGTYNLTLMNTSNDCVSIENFVIEGALPVGIAVLDSQAALCHDSNDGSATVAANGGDGEFEYLWPDGSTDATNSNLAAGVYTVMVTDGNDCTAEVLVEITAPDEVLLIGVATDETSADANDGTVEVIVSGGTGTYTYLWSTGETSSEVSNLEPGEYTVVVTDENGCTNEISVDVNAFGCNVSADVLGTDISCYGMNDGSATVDFEGGDILSVEWSNGETGLSISDLEPGIYNVLVVDVDNCPAEANIEIVEPAEITTELVDSGGLLCPGDEDGYIVLEGFGGTGELSPQWSTGSTEWAIYGLSAGEEYSLTITDENQCSESMIIITNEPISMTASSDVVDVSCFGLSDGSINAFVTGGTSPYIYEWSTGENEEIIFGLEAGIYSLDIIDANGCVITNEYTINEPTAIDVELVDIQTSSGNEPTGSVTVNTGGGVEPYTYAWYLDNELVSTDENLQDVGPGSYDLVVTDANDCAQNFGPFVVDVDVSVHDIVYDFSLEVYPNPSNGLFYLEVSDLRSSDEMQIELLDLTGKQISQKLVTGSTDYTEQLDLSAEAAGVYFLKVVLSDQVQLVRLINK